MIISRRALAVIAATPLLSGVLPAGAAETKAEKSKKVHRVAIQVDGNDAATMNLALNNIQNMFQHYGALGEQLEIRLVTFGPGLHMVREDTSPVKERLASMKSQLRNLSVVVCNNTKQNMEKAEGKQIPITPLGEMVASGVVELVKLQENGWTYLRP
jgi:intracellular sulfur oxidation DsrE/DsrF family protein